MRRKDERLEYQKIHDKSISEAAFQRSILEVADMWGWTTHHETDSRRSKAGFPDLVCCHPNHGVVFMELKAEGKYLRPEQKEWRDALTLAGANYYVFRPRDRFVVDDLFTKGEYPDMKDYDH